MEEQLTLEVKTIEDYHGEIFTVPASTLEKCNLFQHIADFADNDFDFEKKDIWDQLFSRRFPKRDFSFFERTATDTPLSKEILKTAFECIEQPKECESLPKEQIRSVFAAVNFLNPKKEKVAKKLARQMKAIIPHEELKEDNEIDYIVLSELHEKSINNIIRNKLQDAYFDVLHPQILNFYSMKINNLNGIKNLKVDKSKITLLDISDNHLTILDINYLLKEFPNLATISAEDCLITKVIFPKQLPPNMEIFLYGNSIKQLPMFHMNDNCTLDIRGNPLSQDAYEKIKKALIPPFFKMNQHYLYLFKESFKTFIFYNLVGISASGWFIWAPIGIDQLYKTVEQKDTSPAFKLLLGIFSAPTYICLKGEQLLGFGNSHSFAHKSFLQFVDKYSLASGFLIGASAVAWKLYKNKFEYKKHQYVQTAQIFTDDYGDYLDESAGI